MDGRAILELVEHVARFAGAWEAREARAPRADAPGRDGEGEGCDPGYDRFEIDARAPEAAAEGLIILRLHGGEFGVLLADQRVRNAIGHGPSLPAYQWSFAPTA